jgi:serine phosphatase RsbU (regulator of sigma subunit)
VPALNKKLVIIFALLIFTGCAHSLHAQESLLSVMETEPEFISPELMTGENNIIYIGDLWRFMPGDSLAWASPEYDDSDWEAASTNLTHADLSFIEWEGIGWFRKTFRVAPELRETPVALLIDRHFGASEIYLNGVKIHELGVFSTDPSLVQTYSKNNPLVIVFPDKEEHVLAVRFINPDIAETDGQIGYNGFRFLLADWESYQGNHFSFIAEWTSRNMFYIGVLLTFAIIHFFLFVFYPAEIKNLFFSLFVGLLAVLAYLFYRIEMSSSTFDAIYIFRFISITEVIVLAFAARFTHSIDNNTAPFYSNAIILTGVAAAILIWIYPLETVWLKELLVILFMLEILRTVGVMFYHNLRGVWILGAGVLMFVLGLAYSIMVNFDFIDGNLQTGNMFGAGFLVFSMSIYLSREFASTQKNLLQKLEEVKILSQKTLQQEKMNKKREIERRLLEAENSRKSKELEEARQLQLSMLPKNMPEIPGLDIAVYMDTATEVGGDYYDYSFNKNGSLLLAIGDATGHGMKAGIMVAAAKSYFHTFAHESDRLAMLKKISSGLRNLNLKMMYMGMMLIHYRHDSVEIATAGMPPALHYSYAERRVRRVQLKGLPLGSKVDYPYQSHTFEFKNGDVLLLMSDGLTELFNPNRDMLELEKIEELLNCVAENSAADIIECYSQLIKSWADGLEPHDDITMMVLKKNGINHQIPEN